ncbi:MAG: WD40/YVTN/BNR-like repeat-containing protein, partial [Acidimicrobiales bacterium]
MFEHLDDPNAPEVTARQLAVVLSRSAAQRRRRSFVAFGILGLCLLLVGVTIGMFVNRGTPRFTVTNLASRSGSLLAGLGVPTSELVGTVFPDDQHGFALTSGAGRTALVATSDGGSTWTVIQGNLPVGSAGQLDFVNASDGYLWGGSPTGSGTLPLWVTDDGGDSWSRAAVGPVVSDVTAIGSDVWAVVGTCPISSGSDAPSCPVVLEESKNGGASWTASADPPPLAESTAPSVSDQDVELARMTKSHAYLLSFDPVASGVEGTLARLVYTADGGMTWSVLPDPCAAGYDYSEIAGSGTDDLWLLCAGQAGGGSQAKALYRSHDGGMAWTLAADDPMDLENGPSTSIGTISAEGYVAPFSLGHDNLAVISPTVAWLFPARGDVYKTTDGGRVWFAVKGLAGFSSVS